LIMGRTNGAANVVPFPGWRLSFGESGWGQWWGAWWGVTLSPSYVTSVTWASTKHFKDK
jgi:hypothetical protein